MADETDLARALRLLADLTSDEACDFDHHGGCQAHLFLSLQPGEICSNEQARRLLAEHGMAP